MTAPRRRPAFLAVLAGLACLFGLYTLAPELLWALAGPAVDPGPLGAASLGHDRHVVLSGTALDAGLRAEREGEARAAVRFLEAPVLVLRSPGLPPTPGPLRAQGRLLRGDLAGPWQSAVDADRLRSPELAARWLLVEGEAPRIPWGRAALALLLLVVLAMNVSVLVGRLRAR